VKIELSRDWTEFLSALIARRVRFVLVGGHAVAGHGEPRLTEDLDVFVEPTAANARRLRDALVDFGFGAVAPGVVELAAPDKIFMLGRKPWRIDILTGIDGVTFAEAWATKIEAEFATRPLYVIGREALIANKRAAARDKDLLDVALLTRGARPSRSKKRRTRKR
jgi:Nucleotidyl transferase AbiEii toxin, Type IV TA system